MAGASTACATPEVEPTADLVARKHLLPDVLDARDSLETKLAQLAADRRTDEDLAQIDAALAFMQTQIDADEVPINGDRKFHAAVVRAAHSELLAAFLRGDQRVDRPEPRRVPSTARPPDQSMEDHERIAVAIRERDEAAAAGAMHAHVDPVSKSGCSAGSQEAEPRGH